MKQDLDRVDTTLRRAYADLAAIVTADEAGPATERARPAAASRTTRLMRSRRLSPVAIAAAVVVIAAAATLVPRALDSGSRLAAGSGAGPPMAYLAAVATRQDSVIPVNLASGIALPAISLGIKGSVTGVAMTSDRKTLYVATVRGLIAPVNLVTGTAGSPIVVGGVAQGMAMTPDGRTAYLLEPPYGVAVVNLSAGRKTGFIKISQTAAFALTPDGSTLYVVNRNGSRVTPVDTATGRLQRPIALPAGTWPPYIAVSPNGRTVYVSSGKSADNGTTTTSVLTPINTSTNSAGKPIRLGNFFVAAPITTSPDGQTAYVSDDGTVVPVSLATETVGSPLKLPVSPMPYQVAVSPGGGEIYAADGSVGRVYRVAASGHAPAVTVRLGAAGQWGAGPAVFGPDGTTVYVLSWNEQQTRRTVYYGLLTPVNAATGRAGKSIRLRSVPAAIEFGS